MLWPAKTSHDTDKVFTGKGLFTFAEDVLEEYDRMRGSLAAHSTILVESKLREGNMLSSEIQTSAEFSLSESENAMQ